MSLVVGDYSEMDRGGQEEVDKLNDETFGSGTEGERIHFLASPLLARDVRAVYWETRLA